MTEYPSQTQTGTVTQTQIHQTTVVQPYIKYDPEYIKTVPGIIKILCIVLNLIGFICISVSVFSAHSRGGFFNTVSMIAFWFTGIMLACYIFHVCEKFHKIPWLKIEMYFCGIWTLLYMLASSLVAAMPIEAFQAAAFFGFCAMIAYGYDAFLKYKGVKAGEIAQGQRNVQVQQQTISTVSY